MYYAFTLEEVKKKVYIYNEDQDTVWENSVWLPKDKN